MKGGRGAAVARWVLPLVGSVATLVAGALIVRNLVGRGVGAPTPWSGDAAGALWLVGLALVVAACLWAGLRASARAALFGVIATAWVAPLFASWLGGPAAVVAVAPALAVLALPAMWQLLLWSTAGSSTFRSVAVALPWVGAVAAGIVFVLLRDPFLDPRCTGTCVPNPLLIVPVPWLVAVAHGALDALGAITAAAAVVWSARCLAVRARVSALAPAPAVVVMGAAWVASPLAPGDTTVAATLWWALMALTVVALAVASIAAAAGGLRRAALMRALVDDLAAGAGGDLRSRLSAALGDPRLEVVYPLEEGRWVDADGRDRERPDAADSHELRRQGETIAVVVGGGGRVSALADIGPAANLAIDNERLRAGIAARLADLRASRLGVVEAGDDERRRIERNLHDGMQQSLLVLQYELGIAASRADDAAESARLGELRDEAHDITERLRAVAHGVFPAALDDLGVEVALQRLVEDSPFPLKVSGAAVPRPPRPIERTVYLVADETCAAGAAAPGAVTIGLDRVAEELTVRTHNASRRISVGLRDRIEALGGIVAPLEAGLEVRLPCASS